MSQKDKSLNSTESPSHYEGLENLSTRELIAGINEEDKSVAISVGKSIDQIERLVDQICDKMNSGGRLFYIGAGTSGRLGI